MRKRKQHSGIWSEVLLWAGNRSAWIVRRWEKLTSLVVLYEHWSATAEVLMCYQYQFSHKCNAPDVVAALRKATSIQPDPLQGRMKPCGQAALLTTIAGSSLTGCVEHGGSLFVRTSDGRDFIRFPTPAVMCRGLTQCGFTRRSQRKEMWQTVILSSSENLHKLHCVCSRVGQQSTPSKVRVPKSDERFW